MSEGKFAEKSFFSPGTRIEGTLEIEGEIKLQGQISGKVTGTGVVTVGEQANVRADVHGAAVIVKGVVRGEIHARDRLELHSTAQVRGLLKAPRVRIDEGALFEGECRMAAPEAPKSEPAKLEERRQALSQAPSTAVASGKNLFQR